MKIAACVKYSLDVSEVKVDASSKQLRLSGVPRKLGNIDKIQAKSVLQQVVQSGPVFEAAVAQACQAQGGEGIARPGHQPGRLPPLPEQRNGLRPWSGRDRGAEDLLPVCCQVWSVRGRNRH